MPQTNLRPESEIKFLQLSYQLVNNNIIKVIHLQYIPEDKLAVIP